MGDKIYVAKQDTLLEVQQTVNKTDTTIGDIGDPAGEESLVGLVKNIPASVPTGVIKSVQRGVITSVPDTGMSGKVYEIPINTVDPNKSFVILNTGNLSAPDSNGDGIILTELLANVLKVKVCTFNAGAGNDFSWQVIECF